MTNTKYRDTLTVILAGLLMASAAVGAFLFVAGCSTPMGGRQNRACILAEGWLEQLHKDGRCESTSLGETMDVGILYFDGGKRMCHDVLMHGPKEGPLSCDIMKPTTEEIAAETRNRAEAEAKAKIEADAKTKAEAEAKARADVAAGDLEHIRMHQAAGDYGSGTGSAKGRSPP